MFKWQTIVDIPRPEWHASVDSRWLLLGSCFSDEVGRKMNEHYLRVTCNPFGTLYNPMSIAQAMLTKNVPALVKHGGLWHAMSHHGSFSYPTHEETEDAVRTSIRTMQKSFDEADIIIVTFGTAWIYVMKEDGQVVGNCHKIPSDRFVRKRLTIEEIVETWYPLIKQYKDKKWIFTVSPIRHVKDGLHENQLSKATLLQAVEQLTLNGLATYFPSYEIMIDELRDYRFYADDLVHPSSSAVDYIWQRFVETYFSSDTLNELDSLSALWHDRHHTLLHPQTVEAQAFMRRVEQRTNEMKQKYPWIQ
ncbi:MAG: GSCFA domain-containing protein [Paludibacteraceae bacterium]|nr:GSCFA domain-containing protein [Paludibacteraceae bacterium]